MTPRNAVLACLLALSAAAGTRLDARSTVPHHNASDVGLIAGESEGLGGLDLQDPKRQDTPPAGAAEPRIGGVVGGLFFGVAEPIGLEDAKVLRAVLELRFADRPAPLRVLERTVPAVMIDRSADDSPGKDLSLRGGDLGPNVTLVTTAALEDGSAESPATILFSRPVYTAGRDQVTVRYKITKSIFDNEPPWLRGTVTLGLGKDGWAVISHQESPKVPHPLRVGGDVKAPVVLKRVEAVRTAEAIQNRISGLIILEVGIDDTGHVTDVRVLKPLPFGLNDATVAAVKQWEFRPGTLNGEPVPVIYNVTVNFKNN